MADFLVQGLNCSPYNFYSIAGGTQLALPETCGQLTPCSTVDVVHYNNGKENATFNESVAAQVVNISHPVTNTGRRHYSYVPEAVQLEVDGINTQALFENQPLKDSSPAFLSEEFEQIFADLTTGTDETTLPNFYDLGLVSDVDRDNSINLPNSEIFNQESADVTGCSSTLFCPPIPEKEAYPTSLLAVTPSGPPKTVKRKAHRHGNKVEAPPSEAPKKKRLWQAEPFADKSQEKKRKDAVRAKKNRERNKEFPSRLQVETEKVKRLEKELAECKLKLAESEMKRKALEKIVGASATGNYSPA